MVALEPNPRQILQVPCTMFRRDQARVRSPPFMLSSCVRNVNQSVTCHFAQVLPPHVLRESTMPSPLTPSSSQEIIPISPPPYASSSKSKSKPTASTSTSTSAFSISTTLPQPAVFTPESDLLRKIRTQQHAYDAKAEVQGGKRKARRGAVDEERERAGKMSRSHMTERMVGIRRVMRVSRSEPC